MTIDLAFDSVTPRAPGDGAARLAVPRTAIARAMRSVDPHVDQARWRRAAQRTPVDDVLCSVAATVLLVAVALPLPALVSMLA